MLFDDKTSGTTIQMKRYYTLLVLLTISIFTLSGFASNLNHLKFNFAGTFKIVQFTDTHISYSRLENSMKSIETMRKVLDLERPDLVVFTGDNIVDLPLKEGLEMLIEPISTRNIPFIMLFGNHDNEEKMGVSREELGEIVRKLKGYYNVKPEIEAKDANNYIIEIKNAKLNKTEALLYCLDSNDYDSIAGKKVYAGFNPNQIEWYRNKSKQFTQKNHNKPVPSLAFFHIPLFEYSELCDTSTSYVGMYKEKPCPPIINTGMFAAMLKCGDIMGCFVGHDHDNDFVFNKFGIYLGYGRFTGSNNTYCHCENGARVIVLKQGKREFTSWIRLGNGAKLNEIKYPDSIPLLNTLGF